MLMVLVTRMNFIVIPCVSARWDFGRHSSCDDSSSAWSLNDPASLQQVDDQHNHRND